MGRRRGDNAAAPTKKTEALVLSGTGDALMVGGIACWIAAGFVSEYKEVGGVPVPARSASGFTLGGRF